MKVRHAKIRWVHAAALLCTGALLLITGAAARATAQQPSRSGQALPREAASGDDAVSETEKHWLEKLADAMVGHETNEYAREHATVLEAFRQTVAYPSKSTVRIWCEDRQTALGIIVDSDGYVATKASELIGRVECELSDGSRHDATLVSADRGSDLALLKIAASNLPMVRWSMDEPPSVGGWVITPDIPSVPPAIGIVSVAPHEVRGGVLGIQMTEDRQGPRVTYVVPESGAAQAGLVVGDIITGANDQAIKTSDDMVAMTSNLLPGETIQLSIRRLEESKQLTAVLGSVADTLTSRRARFQDQLGSPLSRRRVLFPSVLEHDTALSPNQCGGVLVNLAGEAIGVNVARASRISSYAIPASVARPILESLKEKAARSESVPVATRTLKPELPEAAAGR